MPISQTSTEEKIIQQIACNTARAVTEQPHYWRGIPPTLQVSRSDLETDIAYEVARLLRQVYSR